MNCEQFREIVHDVARDEALGFGTLQEALSHSEHCRECDALLEEAEALTANLRALAERHAPEGAPARVEAALLRAFREKHAVAARPNRRGLWAFAAFGTAAAAVLLTIVLLHDPGSASQDTAVRSSEESVAPAQPSDLVGGSEAEAELSLTSDPSVDFMDGWPVSYEDSSNAGPFVPLSDTFDPAAMNINSVVRLAMPRPALEKLGVHLKKEGDGPVVADLVISGDGTPQAIRVVEW